MTESDKKQTEIDVTPLITAGINDYKKTFEKYKEDITFETYEMINELAKATAQHAFLTSEPAKKKSVRTKFDEEFVKKVDGQFENWKKSSLNKIKEDYERKKKEENKEINKCHETQKQLREENKGLAEESNSWCSIA